MAVHAEDLVYDKRDQLEKIEGFCQPDEVIRAVFDLKHAATGFLGITDRRVIFFDKAYAREQKAMVSIPYSRISTVGSADDRGFVIKKGFLVTDRLTITGLGFEERTFEFRGGYKAHHAHNVIMEYMI
jgi:hypothetical protein